MRKIGFPFLMVVLIGLDQFVKAWTVANIELDTVEPLLPGVISLAYLRNYGAAWSILQNQQWFFTIMTIVAVTGLVWYYIKQIKGNIWTLFSLSLMIAGALGNFIDCLRLGYVVDMFHLDFISFPVFNVADVCLTVGVGILFICIMKKRVMEVRVEVGGIRLDKALSDLTDLSRSVANEQIKAGQVLVNGQPKKAKYSVQVGDVLTYQIPEVEEIDYVAEDIPLEIVFQDEDVAVVNKPQGMVVHPSAGHTSGTLVNALLYHVKDLSGINGVLRPGIVHRIDKDTSGLLMIAKNDDAHTKLAAELKDKKSLRKYWAIVHGNLPNDRGVIEAPIGRSEKDRKKQAVTAKGKEAVTRFQVLERFGDYTLVELTLETGRTHQIRVHMAYIGHPVAGDEAYGPRKTLKGHGQFLHARTLGFTHPRTGEVVEFTAEAPAIFQEALEKLRKAE